MENGTLYPSIYMKIRRQPCTFIRNFQKTQASNSIPATFAFFNEVLQSRLGPPHQGSASTTVTTMPSKVPSEKGNAIDEVLILLYAVTSIMTTAPVNRVMHLMRCQNEMIKSGRLSHPYKGIGDCFARTVRNEGIFSLWKGNTAYIMGLMTDKFIFGSAMDNCLSLFNYKKEDGIGKKHPLVLAAECLSRAVTLLFSHPLEYSQTRMANDIKTKSIFEKGQFNGIFDVFRKTLKSDGIAGLYRGYNMMFFASFVSDLLFFALKPKGELLEMLGLQHTMLAITMEVTGHYLLGNLITYPIHTVIQRMMMRSGEAVKYKNSFDAFSQIIKNEGVLSLYKGASAQIIRFSILGGFTLIYVIISNKNEAGS